MTGRERMGSVREVEGLGAVFVQIARGDRFEAFKLDQERIAGRQNEITRIFLEIKAKIEQALQSADPASAGSGSEQEGGRGGGR